MKKICQYCYHSEEKFEEDSDRCLGIYCHMLGKEVDWDSCCGNYEQDEMRPYDGPDELPF